MQFILTLFLTLALFYSVECATTCLSCKDRECEDGDIKILTCPFVDAVCVSATVTTFNQSEAPNQSFDLRTCTRACPGPLGVQDEISWNMRYMRVSATFECCDGDNCNNHSLPFPEPDANPNGLMCRSCSNPREDKLCTTMFPCQGVEDRCFFETTIVVRGAVFQRGCISRNLCSFFPPFFANLSEGVNGHLACRPMVPFRPPKGSRGLQNLAVSFRLSVTSLLLSFIAFTVIH